MSLRGLPDFQRPIQGEGFRIFYPYEGGESYYLVPDHLEVAEHSDGSPDFSLEFVRGENPLLPPKPYGVLDFRIRPRYRIEEALKFLRDRHPKAMLMPSVFASGFVRMQPVGDEDDFAEELLKPVPIAWNSLGIARYILKFSQDSVVLLKKALQDELLGLYATAEMEMVGVSPRLSIEISFDPKELLSALFSLGSDTEEAYVARKNMVRFFHKNLRSLPLKLIGEINDLERNEFAEAMTDRVHTRFGRFVPSPEEDVEPYVALVSPERVGSGTFQWDLSEPLQVKRTLVLTLHPLEAARKIVALKGIENVMRETVVPSIPTGLFSVSISANLPSERLGILSLGVTIHVPPRPPARVQALVESKEVGEKDLATILLRLSSAEELEYTFSTFVVIKDSRGTKRLDGEEILHSGDKLDLTPEHFPVDFMPVGASHDLLKLAVVHGSCRWSEDESTAKQSFKLDIDRPAVVIALPKGAEDAVLEIEARSRDDSKMINLGPIPAKGIQLGLYSFPEYGPQRIEIECLFGDGIDLIAIDLLPEDRAETKEEITVLHFTPDRSKKEWTYLAHSPFHCGYRYRPHRGPDVPQGAWSDIRSPFESLAINAETIARGGR